MSCSHRDVRRGRQLASASGTSAIVPQAKFAADNESELRKATSNSSPPRPPVSSPRWPSQRVVGETKQHMCTCTSENIDGFVAEKGCAREGDRQTVTPLYHSQSERSHAVPVSPPWYRLLFFSPPFLRTPTAPKSGWGRDGATIPQRPLTSPRACPRVAQPTALVGWVPGAGGSRAPKWPPSEWTDCSLGPVAPSPAVLAVSARLGWAPGALGFHRLLHSHTLSCLCCLFPTE